MTQCWIVTEGMAGTENQCIGVAEALGVNPAIKRIGLRQPWKSLSPHLPFETRASFTGDPLEGPWPDLVLASGRKAIAAARYIKRMSGGRAMTVFIQDPRYNPRIFDLVAVPEHDPTRGDNVLVTTGAPNRVNEQRLIDARHEWAHLFEPMKSPRVGVLIGGNSKAYKMPLPVMKQLAERLRGLSESGHSLMVTASRRTGEENAALLHETLSGTNAYIWDGSGANPYFGMLAWADYIIVTADSVSMLCEAATTGKPVYMAALEGGTKRFDRFHNHIVSQGFVRPFEGALEPYTYPALADAAKIAAKIRQKLGKA